MISDTKDAASSAINSTASSLRVPMNRYDRIGPSDPTPHGLGNVSETPPGGGKATSLGRTRNPIMARAVIRKITHVSGRQRGDGRVPEGNNRAMKPKARTFGTKNHSASRPTTSGAGNVPGWVRPSM